MSTLAISSAREIFDLLRDDLVAIEQELGHDSASGVSTITEIAAYLREGGGKRIRPSLLLLTARMLGHTGQSAIRLGAVVEMVHTATLVHDDIIDGARDAPRTALGQHQLGQRKMRSGRRLALYAGLQGGLEEKNLRVLDLLIGLTQQMVEGELLQIEKLGKAVHEAEYYDLIYPQNRLPLLPSRCGWARCWPRPAKPRRAAWPNFGRAVGLAFQIVDDVLDLTATEEVMGKPVASDLREGKATLPGDPLVRSRHRGRPAHHPAGSGRPGFEHVSREQLQEILARNGSVEYAMAAADRCAEKSRQALAALADSDFKRALLWVPDFVVAREK